MRLTGKFVVTLLAALSMISVQALADDNVLDDADAVRAVELVRSWRGDTSQLLVELGAIESPSGEEHTRAVRVAEEMRRIGLSDVRITVSPNVIGRIPGRSSGPATVFVSTLDDLRTVVEHQRARGAPPSIEGDRIVGPGTNTSSTTAAMLTAVRALVAVGHRTRK